MRFAALFFSLFILAPMHRAHASGAFDVRDRYVFIQQVEINKATGQAIIFGRKLRVYTFVLPYAAVDEGYVLYTADLTGYEFSPLAEAKLKSLQARKLLPDPLPPFQLSATLYMEFYSLWLLVVLPSLLIFGAIAYRQRRSIMNAVHSVRGDWRAVVDPDVADMLKRIQKLKRIQPASNGQELARVRARTGYSDCALWLLALDGALLTGFRGDPFSLDAGLTTPQQKSAQRKSLVEWWGVASREDLIKMLANIRRGMHSHEYNRYLGIWRGPQDGVKACMRLDRDSRKNLQLIGGTTDIVGARSLLAWDFGRGIMLSTSGFAVGYLTEQEAWSYMKSFGDEIGKHYASWQDYGLNYLIGRVFWAEDKASYFDGTEDALRWLYSREGAWSVAPWPNAGKARVAA